MEGFLKIKREIFSEKYYFVLTSDCLVFYKKKGEPVKGRFHLKISTITNADEKKPLNIILNNGFQDVLLEAEDIKKKMQWTNAILMRQDELRRLDNQDFYDMHNLDEIISKDAQISEEVKDNLENKFVNSLAELWNLQAIVEENLDNLASKFEKNNIIQVTFKKVEGAVANIKKIITNFSNYIKEEKMRIYRLYKLLNDCRTSFFRQGSPFKQKHNTSILYSKQLSIDNDPRLIYGENTKSLSCRHELSHHYNNMSGTDKFIKNKEKIEESDMESYKDVENSFYNEFSEDKIEGNNKNPLEMFNNGIFSHQSNDRVKIDIETLKEKSPRKYAFIIRNPVFSKYNLIDENKRLNLSFFKIQRAKLNFGSIFQMNRIQKNLNNLAIYALEPLTQLQKFCEQFENASYLNEASNQEFEPCMKMAYVIAFCVQGLLSSKNRCHFPFPSLLGETYELDYKEDQIKFKFLSEQINIDPNTIAYHCKSDTFEAWGTVIYEFNYWGKSFEIEPRGVNYIRLNNGNNFVYSNAYKIKTFNLENDNPQTCIEGDITFENLETKDHGDITFRKESLVSTNYNFMGSIKNSKGETKFRLFGIWNSTFIVQNTQTKKSIELWKKPNVSDSMLIIDSEQTAFSDFALQLNFLNMDLIEKLPLSDSRFRSDVKALELGEIKFANEEKNRIDGIQNEKMSEKFQYKPKFFEENKEKNENRKEYIFKGNYWKLKEDGKLGDYIDSLF